MLIHVLKSTWNRSYVTKNFCRMQNAVSHLSALCHKPELNAKTRQKFTPPMPTPEKQRTCLASTGHRWDKNLTNRDPLKGKNLLLHKEQILSFKSWPCSEGCQKWNGGAACPMKEYLFFHCMFIKEFPSWQLDLCPKVRAPTAELFDSDQLCKQYL